MRTSFLTVTGEELRSEQTAKVTSDHGVHVQTSDYTIIFRTTWYHFSVFSKQGERVKATAAGGAPTPLGNAKDSDDTVSGKPTPTAAAATASSRGNEEASVLPDACASPVGPESVPGASAATAEDASAAAATSTSTAAAAAAAAGVVPVVGSQVGAHVLVGAGAMAEESGVAAGSKERSPATESMDVHQLQKVGPCAGWRTRNKNFYKYRCNKVSLRGVSTGVAQERIITDRACDIVSYAYDTMLRRFEISAYSCCTHTGRHVCAAEDPFRTAPVPVFWGRTIHGNSVELLLLTESLL